MQSGVIAPGALLHKTPSDIYLELGPTPDKCKYLEHDLTALLTGAGIGETTQVMKVGTQIL